MSLSLLPSIVIADPPDKVNLALPNMLMKGEHERLKRDMEMQRERLKSGIERESIEQKNFQKMAREREMNKKTPLHCSDMKVLEAGVVKGTVVNHCK